MLTNGVIFGYGSPVKNQLLFTGNGGKGGVSKSKSGTWILNLAHDRFDVWPPGVSVDTYTFQRRF